MKKVLAIFLLCCVGCASTARDEGSAPSVDEKVDETVDEAVEEVVEDANKAIVSGVAGSDIWLGNLHRGEQWSISDLRNITTRPGYDNQPAFKPNGTGVYYTSIRDGAQADVRLYEEIINASIRFTSTPQSEFSPTPLPGGKGISVVRVEADGKQQLWQYKNNQAMLLHSDIDNIGYYTWLDAQTIAMFRVTEPPSLALATVPNGQIKTIPVEPGRSLHRHPETGALSFVDKTDSDNGWVSVYDRDTKTIERIAPTLDDGEDFAWTPDGELLMASGKIIFVWRDKWETAVDLTGLIPGEINRIQVGPQGAKIVFVASEGGS